MGAELADSVEDVEHGVSRIRLVVFGRQSHADRALLIQDPGIEGVGSPDDDRLARVELRRGSGARIIGTGGQSDDQYEDHDHCCRQRSEALRHRGSPPIPDSGRFSVGQSVLRAV